MSKSFISALTAYIKAQCKYAVAEYASAERHPGYTADVVKARSADVDATLADLESFADAEPEPSDMEKIDDTTDTSSGSDDSAKFDTGTGTDDHAD